MDRQVARRVPGTPRPGAVDSQHARGARERLDDDSRNRFRAVQRNDALEVISKMRAP